MFRDHLRIALREATEGGERREFAPAPAHDCGKRRARKHAVARGQKVAEDDVSRLFRAYGVAVFQHTPRDVVVAYIRADEGYPALFEGGFRPHVGVKGANRCGEGKRASFQHIAGEDVEYAVAVHDVPLLIAGDDAVGVAVEGEPEIGVLCPDRFGEDLGVQRTAAVVDVRAVEGGGCGMHFRARPLEHFGRDRRSGAAGAVQHDAQPGKSSCAGAYRRDIVLFQGGRGEGRPPPFGVVEPSSCEVAFHSFLPVAGELFRRREKDFQAVVAGGIVGGGHHDAARRARCAGGKSHARGGDDA